MIFKNKPDVIVECGTERGGSALFFAHMFDLMGEGQVITIDKRNNKR
ncbi:MAG: CmcI family methyltransferase, partial [Candidatus Thorarchaeota archaeon]